MHTHTNLQAWQPKKDLDMLHYTMTDLLTDTECTFAQRTKSNEQRTPAPTSRKILIELFDSYLIVSYVSFL
jgi:hypothetical protein